MDEPGNTNVFLNEVLVYTTGS